MSPQEFVTWLSGFAERTSAPPTPAEWSIVVAKLATVFEKVTVKTVSGPSADVAKFDGRLWVQDPRSPSGGFHIDTGKAANAHVAAAGKVEQTYCTSLSIWDGEGAPPGYKHLQLSTGEKPLLTGVSAVDYKWPFPNVGQAISC